MKVRATNQVSGEVLWMQSATPNWETYRGPWSLDWDKNPPTEDLSAMRINAGLNQRYGAGWRPEAVE